MQIFQKSHKQTRFILMVFLLVATLIIISKFYSLYQIQEMKKLTNDLFEYPFKVSNATLLVQSDVYRIHRDMKDIVLSESDEELQLYIRAVNTHEQHIYHYLDIIQQKVKDKEGKKLEEQTRALFHEWKPIRDEVITLVKNHKRGEAIAITKGKGANQVLKLEHSTLKLHIYAQTKASDFKAYSDVMHEQFRTSSISIGIAVMLLLFLMAYYSIRKISNYIFKNAHLTNLLSVIRDVNQLIVREKNKEKLVQEICTIMVSNRIYSNAWIILYDDAKCMEYITSADDSENFSQLKNKIENGWMPHCIKNIPNKNIGHLLIENTAQSCLDCPFKDLYENKGAFSIPLAHHGTVFGNLTLSVNPESLNDIEETSLLHEVAGDISYALYNIKIEQNLYEHTNKLTDTKELYENIIDSVDNILFVKDSNFTYIVCNQAFEQFVGKTSQEIIGKSDYEIFDKEVADFFRHHDEKMFEENSSKSNFEWVTYPDGTQVYLFTVKSPLINSVGKILGLVGNSANVTELRIAEEALTQKKKELETILQEAPNPIMLHNENGEVVMVNHVWQSLSGYRYEEINTVEKWAEKACAKNKPLMHQYMDILYSLQHKIDMGEASVTTKGGNTLIWQFSSAPLGIIDGKRTVVTSAMDITELKKKDEMMMAQSRHAAMGEMIGMIAHQWRQPIAGIAMDANNMLIDIAFETFNNDSAEGYAQDILEQTKHLSKTIDDFRNFFKPDKAVATVKVENIMDETLLIVKESIVNHAIKLVTSYESESYIDAYPRELMQVFVNVINNARDSLVLNNIDYGVIEIRTYDDEQYVNTEICDNGGGIDESILPKIFDPYFSTKDEKTGTGLGLYMSKMIVEEHLHGIIEASNNNNNGACFKIRLLRKEEVLQE
ncbi:MAG: PAS domain S-box protein [Sulfuricurvum sp.]|uniref:PAS domain S-box protein n=1 Tax=Sulfuricurvum sp. TaxID=2025608 RepID=UPI0025E88F9C|nr:PAS domain S-box protein [Sulfuricurvum sp.]MBV5320773.1 PAS domain S-box protein [Sulfuricurvum sp.]